MKLPIYINGKTICPACRGSGIRGGSIGSIKTFADEPCTHCKGTGIYEYGKPLEKIRMATISFDRLSKAAEGATKAVEELRETLPAEAPLTPEEQALADRVEESIEDQLDEWHATDRHKNRGVVIDFGEATGNHRIEDYLMGRFSGWEIDVWHDGSIEFKPK